MPLQSLWAATAPEGPACSALAGPHRAQAVVIGAGYTGLSAALHLAEAGRDVIVLEAGEIGERASGVNGGQVIPGVKLDPDNLEALLGPYAGGRLVATAAAGPDLVFDLISRHGIQCDAVRTGWIQPATSDATLQVRGARSTTSKRPVFATESRMVLRSIGTTVLMSTTSAEMPSSSS